MGASNYDILVTLLSNGIHNRKLYFGDHPRVMSTARDYVVMLQELCKRDRKESFFLGVVDGSLVHNGRFLLGPTIVGRRLVEFAEKLCSGGLLFKSSTGAEEISALAGIAVDLKEPCPSLSEARALLHSQGISNIEISPPYQDQGWFGQFLFDGTEDWGSRTIDGIGQDAMIPLYQDLYNTMEDVHSQAQSGSSLDVEGAQEASARMLDTAQGNFMDVLQLVRYPDYDSYTVGHSVRVGMIASLVGHHLGADRDTLLAVSTAGLMHDVGKARVPEEILYKPGRLNAEERRVIESHPAWGAEMLLENPKASAMAVAVAWGHHRRHDGSGYPQASPWVGIDRVTALIHVCDVFEALTAQRPYKEPMTPRQAFEEMLTDRDSFDPAALSTFIKAMGIYPPGSRVKLTTGAEAVVVAAGRELDRPLVRLIGEQELEGEPEGEQAEKQVTLDLSSPAAADVAVASLLVEKTQQA